MSLITAPPGFARAATRKTILTIFSAVLLAPNVQAQSSMPETPPANFVQPAAALAAPKYSSADIDRAFGFMDSSKDGKVSREEAAGFKTWPNTLPQPIPTKTICCRAANLKEL